MRVTHAQILPFNRPSSPRGGEAPTETAIKSQDPTADRITFRGYYGPEAVEINNANPATAHPDLVALDKLRGKLETKAKEKGLDFFPVRFHMLSKEKFLQAAARNGFPERYPHWSWGQEYFQLGFALRHGVNKKLELVQNGSPTPAFLMDQNPPYAQKALMAMAIARSDLYKNNIHFLHTNRRLNEEIAENAAVIREYINTQALGLDTVETFIDKVHSIRNLINNATAPRPVEKAPQEASWERPERDVLAFLLERSPAMEPWQRDIMSRLRSESYQAMPVTKTQLLADGWAAFWNRKLNTENPDLLDFENLTSESRWTANMMSLSPVGLNTYKLGAIIFRHLEERFTREAREELKAEGVDLPEPLLGQDSLEGLERLLGFFEKSLKVENNGEERLEKVREGLERFPMSREQRKLLDERVLAKLRNIRRMESDVSLVRKYLTQDMVEEAFLYTYKPKPVAPPRRGAWGTPQPPADPDAPGTKLVMSSREFEQVREQLIKMFENAGQPAIEVVNPDYEGKGELLLRHIYEYDLKKNYAEKTLTNLSQLWGKPVHLLTAQSDEKGNVKVVRISSDGKGVTSRPATNKDR